MREWVINRIGLINFWYYDDEVFDFSDGRLLLRGSNGSGKSVTMQSFIPLLLDGDKSARRLDPFGTNSRRIENYLLMDGDEADDKTGYLYMEFVKPETKNYLTIGIGLRARKNKPVDFWGFALTDGKRIGKDFFLYKNIGMKLMLTKRELKNRIADSGAGEFCERPSEYKAMVNRHIFGFADISEYDQLIDLLVQLRSPKLSKDYKPTVLYEIMEDSLKPLSDDDLRPMSEAIENMDNIEASITELKNAYAGAVRLRSVYDRYNSGVLYYKAEAYIQAKNKFDEREKEISKLETDIENNAKSILSREEKIEELHSRRAQLEDILMKFRNTDVYRINREIEELEEKIKSESEKLKEKERTRAEREAALRAAVSEKEAAERDCRSKKEKFVSVMSEMAQHARISAFDGHGLLADETENWDDTDFSDAQLLISRHAEGIKNVLEGFSVLENAQKEFEKLMSEHEEEKERYDGIVSGISRSEKKLNEARDKFMETLHEWNGANEQMKMPDNRLQEAAQAVYAFEDFKDSELITNSISAVYGEIMAEKTTKLNIIKSKCKEADNKLSELISKIDRIKREPEIMPELSEEQEEFRELLRKRKIPHIPLYRACDFAGDISEEKRGRIEEALDGMGLLNALIIPEKYRSGLYAQNGAADKFIAPVSSDKAARIGLKPEQGVSVPVDDINAALAGIAEEKGDIFINGDGSYGISILHGFTSGARTAKYIGAQARKRNKERVIAELEAEASLFEEEFNRLSDEERKTARELALLREEYDTRPDTSSLTEALSELKDAQIREAASLKRLEALKDAVGKVSEEVSKYRMELDRLCGGFELQKSRAAFQTAQTAMEKYRAAFAGLIAVYKDIRSLLDKITAICSRVEELEYQIEDLTDDIRDIRKRLNEARNKKQNNEELKRSRGLDDIEKDIAERQSEYDKIPESILAEERVKSRLENDNEHYSAELESKRAAADTAAAQCSYAEEVFREELLLCYNELDKDNIKKSANAAVMHRPEKTLSELKERLLSRYYEERVQLTDYSVAEKECFAVEEQRGTVERRRLKLTARVRGAEVDFYELISYLEKEIRDNEELLTQKDKELFEELLIDTVGRKMRSRISSSERWVEEMNRKMVSMDTSSGLSFSLEWKSKPAENEEQLNTRELVALLKTDSKLLTDENIERISKHFRSKLNSARQRRDEGTSADSMHTILKEILDYRRWFEFRLFYRMTGENKKEMTNNAFYRFSGGEKAMAMYVPLFASVYARYAKAAEYAPKLISLDEAFAGIDDKNIADMFRIMEELKLSYIINSQVLWGTYKTVPSLSICELIRPNNGDTVSVVRYSWNGVNKELVI